MVFWMNKILALDVQVYFSFEFRKDSDYSHDESFMDESLVEEIESWL